MKRMVFIVDSVVTEVFEPYYNEAGDEVPFSERFTPEFYASLFETKNNKVEQGWMAKELDGALVFTPPELQEKA